MEAPVHLRSLTELFTFCGELWHNDAMQLRDLATCLILVSPLLTACGECPAEDAGTDAMVDSAVDAALDEQIDGEAQIDGDAQAGDALDDADTVADPDLHARFLVTHQRVFREDAFFAQGGLGVFEIYDPEALPVDDRAEFFNADGERCTIESGTEWPLTAADGSTWPSGPFANAGSLTFSVDGAPGDVVYNYFDSYYLRDAPGPVMEGGITHNSFFPPEYIPHGRAASLSAAGGTVSSFTIDGLMTADDYSVMEPNLEAGGTRIDNSQALPVKWSPGDEDSQMAVIVKSGFSFVKCVFEDDGESVIPVEAMTQLSGGQFTTFTVQTWRERTQERQVMATDGTLINVSFTSRHVQLGRFMGM